ncbi:hypothetical protein NW762_010775 [Fusarium torreyae]|uniref:Clr5 domain-containing protein n=1 Tax=Fusarium torreyae TaxID=1237075 RepID=A0A9W8RUG1_9HYPO|nr:hypothetical protein NW762_010775 [Fusarium torreyae]
MAATLEAHKSTLTRLYVEEDKTLKDLMAYMRNHHNVNVGKATYERYLRTSGIGKNQKGGNWVALDYKIAKRTRFGKESTVLRNGIPLDKDKVQQEVARHVTTHEQCTRFVGNAPSPATPAGYEVITPVTSLHAPSPGGYSLVGDLSCNGTPSSSYETPAGPIQIPEPYARPNARYGADTVDLAAKLEQDEAFLLESLQDCGAFIIARSSQGYGTAHRSLFAFYRTIVTSLLATLWTPAGQVALEADVSSFKPGFDILLSTCENNEDRVREALQSSDTTLYADVLRASLNFAAGNGAIGVFKVLLTANGNLNLRNSKGRSCLHVASVRNQPAMVEFLLQQGANINATAHDGNTAWSAIGTQETHEEVSQALIRAGASVNHTRPNDGMNSLYQAAAGGHTDSVRVLLRRGADPSYQTPYQWAPLHFASSVEILKLLVEAGADVNAISDTGKTPLDIHHKNQDKRKYLMSRGALRVWELRRGSHDDSSWKATGPIGTASVAKSPVSSAASSRHGAAATTTMTMAGSPAPDTMMPPPLPYGTPAHVNPALPAQGSAFVTGEIWYGHVFGVPTPARPDSVGGSPPRSATPLSFQGTSKRAFVPAHLSRAVTPISPQDVVMPTFEWGSPLQSGQNRSMPNLPDSRSIGILFGVYSVDFNSSPMMRHGSVETRFELQQASVIADGNLLRTPEMREFDL